MHTAAVILCVVRHELLLFYHSVRCSSRCFCCICFVSCLMHCDASYNWSTPCCLERKGSSTGSTFSPYESFRKSSLERPKSGTPDKRDSWNAEDVGTALDTFRPVTITVSSFFKQVPAVLFMLVLFVLVFYRKSQETIIFMLCESW